MIQLSRLEGFYWVGREGGFAAAVRAMPHKISQPAVYQQVRKLELEMECKLFERVGHGQMRLTSQGQRLYDHVAPFYENLSSIVRAVQANEFGGRLRIVAANRLITTLMPNWLKSTQATLPSLQVELTSSSSPSHELLKSGDADIVIDHFEMPNQPGFGQFKIGQAAGFVAVSNNLALRMGQKLDLSQLHQEKFIGYHPTLSYAKRQREAAKALGLDIKTNVYVESVDSILGLVRAGLGYSLIALPEGDESITRQAGVTLFKPPLAAQLIDFEIHAVYRETPFVNPLVKPFLEIGAKMLLR